MCFKKTQINNAKLLEKISPIYQNYYLRDDIFRNQFEDGYKALVCFLNNYAYERQGSPTAYSKIACKCVSNRYQNGNNWRDAKNVWDDYKQIASNDFNLLDKKTDKIKVNETHNPLNEDNGVIDKLASNSISNIATYIRDLIIDSNTIQAYEFIKSIRGIGEKISSFYLRDIVYLSDLDEDNISDLHLLQPIDTWLEQTLKIIFNSDVPKRLQKKQELIVDLCKQSEVSSVFFNQGAWVLGSQIAGDFETFKEALTNYDSGQKIVENHIKEKEHYLCEVRNVLNSLRHTAR